LIIIYYKGQREKQISPGSLGSTGLIACLFFA
jgi:hypothetical protein